MMSDAWPHPLTNIADDIILTNYGLNYDDFTRACHVTLYTDFVRGYATFVTLLTWYSGKFRKLQVICENFICECLVLVDKDRPIALIRKILLAKCSISRIYEIFSHENFPLYGSYIEAYEQKERTTLVPSEYYN